MQDWGGRKGRCRGRIKRRAIVLDAIFSVEAYAVDKISLVMYEQVKECLGTLRSKLQGCRTHCNFLAILIRYDGGQEHKIGELVSWSKGWCSTIDRGVLKTIGVYIWWGHM